MPRAVHAQALAACERSGKLLTLPGVGVSPRWDDRPHAQRGWPTFESAVAIEGLMRALRHPKLTAHLDKLPPKLVDIDAHHGASCKTQVVPFVLYL